MGDCLAVVPGIVIAVGLCLVSPQPVDREVQHYRWAEIDPCEHDLRCDSGRSGLAFAHRKTAVAWVNMITIRLLLFMALSWVMGPGSSISQA